MNRSSLNKLTKWSSSSIRKPLIIRGARQVGKTWLVNEFGKQFNNFIKVDFEQTLEISAVFEQNLDINRICNELELLLNCQINDDNTLLFFDEIQESPRAIMALRYFYEQRPNLHIIAAGSLLEFALDDISFPVGRVQFMELRAMSFKEFLVATDNSKALEIIENQNLMISKTSHQFILTLLKDYWIVGGMPQSVQAFTISKNHKQSTIILDDLAETYKHDFRKYKPKTNASCLNQVLENATKSIGNQIKYTGLSKDFKIPTIKKAFESITMARLINKINAVSTPELPMQYNASEKKFKTVFLDIGLMNRYINLDYSELFNTNNLMAAYRGSLAEQFVCQEFQNHHKQLYYWSRDARNSNAEVDLLLQTKNKVYPIEVKEGSAGKLKSLHLYKENYKPQLSVVLYTGLPHYLKEQEILFMPLYYAGSLAEYGIKMLQENT